MTDITEHRQGKGKLHCAIVVDAFSRMIVGWAIDTTRTTRLVTDALIMAVHGRGPNNGRGVDDEVDEALGDESRGAPRLGGRSSGSSGGSSRRGSQATRRRWRWARRRAVGCRWFRHRGGMPSIGVASGSARYLSFGEREKIALLRAQGAGVSEIARELGRDPSTVSRELRRNAATRGGKLDYRASVAQ